MQTFPPHPRKKNLKENNTNSLKNWRKPETQMGTPDLDMNIVDSGKRQKTTKSYMWTNKKK